MTARCEVEAGLDFLRTACLVMMINAVIPVVKALDPGLHGGVDVFSAAQCA